MSSKFGDPHTRVRILESARELAETVGPAMRVADVAARADVSRNAVYLHFGDRSGLVLALLEHLQQAYGTSSMEAKVRASRDPSERLRRLIEMLATLHGHVDKVGWLFEEAQHLDEGFGRDWRRRAQGTRAFVRQQIAVIADEGALDPEWTVDSAADLVFAVVNLGSWRELTRELGWSRRRYVDRAYGWLVKILIVAP